MLDLSRLVATHDLKQVVPEEQLFERWRQTGLQLLSVNVTVDQFFPVAEMRRFALAAQAAGVAHTHVEFDSPYGHLGCLQDTREYAHHLQALLDTPPPDLVMSTPLKNAHA
ncbi:hypothetical protein ACFSC4_06200 [Deinococcus malanensis]|uniref:hypothetical protein n=1 Tax=Deinococcus malanensis TaxID=1706855 RepID=UPI0036257374